MAEPPPPSSSSRCRLKIGIIGFGPFGQFLSKTILKHGHTITATSRTDHSHLASDLGITFHRDMNGFVEADNDVILISTSIVSLSDVVSSMPFHSLKRAATLFVDVLSVKEYPKEFLLQVLPPESDLLCTHPMFGPESGRDGWNGLSLMYEKVRVRDQAVCSNFLGIFKDEVLQCLSPDLLPHQRRATTATDQGPSMFCLFTTKELQRKSTSFFDRTLSEMKIESTSIDTRNFQSLVKLKESTTKDSFDLFSGLFVHNKYAREELKNLEVAFQNVKRKLLDGMNKELDLSVSNH